MIRGGRGIAAANGHAPSLQATRAETRLTVYRAHASFFMHPKSEFFSSFFEVSLEVLGSF